ncbi:MAG TPA: fused MFS/spermidine synthase [Nitrospiria bacterium]|nr:fused MFS/spermidine synthase [Nitrospiria bacterium]
MSVFLYTISFVSGASALVFETLWFRQAGLALGNSIWASSLVLAGFMGGLAIGNALAAREQGRVRHPLRAYAELEFLIGISGLALVLVFPALGTALAPWLRAWLDQSWALNSIRLVIAFILLLIPSSAMGMTLPLLVKILSMRDRNFGRVLGRLYGWNTFGAVLGAVLPEMVLLSRFGVEGMALVAGLINMFAAAAVLWLSVRFWEPAAAGDMADRSRILGGSGRRWLVSAFLSGFCLLALEVLWFRFLLLYIRGHSVSFALMLGVVLAGIAVGGLIASRWLRLRPEAYRHSASVAFTAGLMVMTEYANFFLGVRDLSGAIIDPAKVLWVGTLLMFLPSLLSGIFFVLAGAALRTILSSENEAAGLLTFANTAGAAVGSLVAGFLLLPVLGIEKSFFLTSLLYGILGAVLFVESPPPRRVARAMAVSLLVGLFFFPFGSMNSRYLSITIGWHLRSGEGRVAAIREGLLETVIYLEHRWLDRPLYYRMLTNSYSMAGTAYQSRRYMKLFVYWPVAVHPDPRHALLISYGVGNTAKALTDTKSIETIDVVDISRDVLEMNNNVYPSEADQPLRDPRIRVHVEDGRFFLQTTDRRFDLITGEPPPPGVKGVVNLYSQEYFRFLRDRLAEGGIVTYWFPLHSMSEVSAKSVIRAFCDAFEDCSLWNGAGTDLMLAGTRNARGPVPEEVFLRQWRNTDVGRELATLGFERPEQLGALFIGDAKYLRNLTYDSQPVTDNFPKRIIVPIRSVEEKDRVFRSLTDVTASRERFRRSDLIRTLWPERILRASLPYFRVQSILNEFLYSEGMHSDNAIGKVHYVLTQTPLRTPSLWLMGSSPDVQRVVEELDGSQRSRPEVQFHVGIRQLSERNYAAAAESLRRAEASPALQQEAFRYRVYAMCMGGERAQTQKRLSAFFRQEEDRLQKMGLRQPGRIQLPPFWSWMKRNFGVDANQG